MGSPNEDNIHRVAGVLIANPSNSTPPNFGGTILGSLNRARLHSGITYGRLYYDEIGRTGEVVAIQKDCIFRAAVREFEDDSWNEFFPQRSGEIVNVGGGLGALSASKGKSYLWAPDRDDEHPAVLLLNAVPLIEADEQSLRLSILFEFNVYVSLLALPLTVSDGVCAKIGLVSKLFP